MSNGVLCSPYGTLNGTGGHTQSRRMPNADQMPWNPSRGCCWDRGIGEALSGTPPTRLCAWPQLLVILKARNPAFQYQHHDKKEQAGAKGLPTLPTVCVSAALTKLLL